jgi:hypothetical protein
LPNGANFTKFPVLFPVSRESRFRDRFAADCLISQESSPNRGVFDDCLVCRGIAIGSDGDIYVNTFNGGDFFRVEVKDGKPGAVTKLETSRPLKLPDGLRLVNGQNFLMVEGSGSLDRVTVNGDKVSIATIKDGLKEPTAVAKVVGTAWVTEGQLSHLFNAKANGPPRLPFEIVPVAVGN